MVSAVASGSETSLQPITFGRQADMDAAEIDGSRGQGRTEKESKLLARREEIYAFPLSLTQQRFWLFDRMAPGNAALNMPITLRLDGPLDTALLASCLNEIVERHEALRSSFEIVDGNPVQLIHSTCKLTVEESDLSGL